MDSTSSPESSNFQFTPEVIMSEKYQKVMKIIEMQDRIRTKEEILRQFKVRSQEIVDDNEQLDEMMKAKTKEMRELEQFFKTSAAERVNLEEKIAAMNDYLEQNSIAEEFESYQTMAEVWTNKYEDYSSAMKRRVEKHSLEMKLAEEQLASDETEESRIDAEMKNIEELMKQDLVEFADDQAKIDDIKKRQDEIKEVEDSNAQLDDEIWKAKDALEIRRKEIDELNVLLKKTLTENDEIREKKKFMEFDNKRLDAELADLAYLINLFKNTNDELLDELEADEVFQRYAADVPGYQYARNLMKEKTCANAELVKCVEEFEQHEAASILDFENAQKELAEHSAEAEKLRKANDEMESMLEDTENELKDRRSSVQASNKDMERNIAELKEELANFERENKLFEEEKLSTLAQLAETLRTAAGQDSVGSNQSVIKNTDDTVTISDSDDEIDFCCLSSLDISFKSSSNSSDSPINFMELQALLADTDEDDQ